MAVRFLSCPKDNTGRLRKVAMVNESLTATPKNAALGKYFVSNATRAAFRSEAQEDCAIRYAR